MRARIFCLYVGIVLIAIFGGGTAADFNRQVKKPTISVSPTVLSFTSGQVSGLATASVSVANKAKSAVTIKKVQIVGDDAKEFKLVGKAPKKIAAKGKIRLSIKFSAKHSGYHNALLRITFGDKSKTVLIVELKSNGGSLELTGVTPNSASIGDVIRLQGRGFGTNPAVVKVFFEALEAQVTSVTDSAISAIVPSYHNRNWYTEQSGYIAATVSGIQTKGILFTITGLPAAAPMFFDQGSWRNNASVGDVVKFRGYGCSPTASLNVLSFSGIEVAASSVEMMPSSESVCDLTTVVPAGATSGNVRVKRLDGYPNDWSDPFTLNIVPASEPRLNGGMESNGIVSPFPAVKGYETAYGFNTMLVLGGGGWNSIESLTGEFTNGASSLSVGCIMLSADRLECPLSYEQFSTLGLTPGKSVSVRVYGQEKTNFQIRYSNWIKLSVREQVILGAASFGGDIGRGDYLALHGVSGPTADRSRFTSALWDGEISLDYNEVRMIPLNKEGAYSIKDHTFGGLFNVNVYNQGAPSSPPYYGFDNLVETGVTLGFGGARVEIPSGALPLHDGSPAYSVGVWTYVNSTFVSNNPEQTSGGYVFGVKIYPEPPALNKPIRIVLPYSDYGRSDVPRFGIWFERSKSFYALGGIADPSNMKIEYEIPAGDYPPKVSASQGSRDIDMGLKAAGGLPNVPPVSLNSITGGMVALSNTHSNGTYEDPNHRFFINYITDSKSTSYVSEAFVKKVASIVGVTYDTIGKHGFDSPLVVNNCEFTIELRDLGPAGDIQGKTDMLPCPSVQLNSRLEAYNKDPVTYSAVAHEIAHVFQRQIAYNINSFNSALASWLDEGMADWAGFESFGRALFNPTSIEDGWNFPAVSTPMTFSGYSADHVYATSAFLIWAEKGGNGRIRSMYRNLISLFTGYTSITLENFNLARSVVEQGMGLSLSDIIDQFAKAYWTQNYEPVKSILYRAPTESIISGSSLTISDSRPAYSSKRYDVETQNAATASFRDKAAVIRAEGLIAGTKIYVYGDSSVPGTIPVNPQYITMLLPGSSSGGQPLSSAKLADSFGSRNSYRVVVVNPTGSSASPKITIAVPLITALNPNHGPKTGTYSVAINGSGFGARMGDGKVKVGGFDQTITSWSDTQITFTMKSTSYPGLDPSVKVVLPTPEDVTTNEMMFKTDT